VVNLIRDALDPRPHFGQIGVDLNRNQVRLVRRRIEEINLAKLVVHQRIPVARQAAKIRPAVMPVSYTHLDVYKRQTQVRFLVDGQPRSTLAGHADLSHTHLASEPLSSAERQQ